MTKKKADIVSKEKKLMEKSRIRKEEFMQSLSNSFHRSTDKLRHVKMRSKEEASKSYAIFNDFKEKIEAASSRKELYIA